MGVTETHVPVTSSARGKQGYRNVGVGLPLWAGILLTSTSLLPWTVRVAPRLPAGPACGVDCVCVQVRGLHRSIWTTPGPGSCCRGDALLALGDNARAPRHPGRSS